MSDERPPAGGGSGGGPDDLDRDVQIAGSYTLSASQVSLLATPDPWAPEVPDPPVVSILATDPILPLGRVEVRGGLGVRVTAGPAPGLPAGGSTTNGVEIAVGELQNVTITRGLLGAVDQKIELTPAGITVDAGSMPVTIESLAEITLKVAGGLAKISITPEGVQIEGLSVSLSGVIEAEVKALMAKLTAEGVGQISGPLTMIG